MVLKFQMIIHQVKRMVMRKWINLNHVHFVARYIQSKMCSLRSNPSGFLLRFKIVPKENKDEETGEEKEENKEEEVE